MARPTHNIVATLGEYTAADGSTKKRYQNCGVAFTDAQGRVSLKLAVVPVDPVWSGWLSLYPMEDRPPQLQQPRPAPAPVNDHVETDEDDDIPF